MSGLEQGGIRPVLIIQNDVGNRHSPTVICAAITSRMNKAKLPTHVEIDAKKYQIVKNSVILLEQVRTIDKQRLKDLVCHLDKEIMNKVDEALKISFEPSYIEKEFELASYGRGRFISPDEADIPGGRRDGRRHG